MARLLYLASGIGLGVYWIVRDQSNRPGKEARLTAKDAPWLAGAFLSGGMIGPMLLLFGLSQFRFGESGISQHNSAQPNGG